MKDKDDSSGGSAVDEKDRLGGAAHEHTDDLLSIYRGMRFDGNRGGDPKADVNGERRPWYEIIVSMVNTATETKTTSVTIGSVLEDIRNGRRKIPVGCIREKYSSELAKAARKAIRMPQRQLRRLSTDQRKTCRELVSAAPFLSGPMTN